LCIVRALYHVHSNLSILIDCELLSIHLNRFIKEPP
jgi:hypothetical protein